MHYALLLFLLSEVIGCTTASNEFVADLSLTLTYSNPINLLENGSPCDHWFTDLKCDVYFEVCVSSNGNRECDLLKQKTPVFTERSHVELAKGGRIIMPLRSPMPRSLRIDVVAWDHDAISGDDLIGKFAIEGSLEYCLQESRALQPVKRSSSSMSMKLELKCRKNWFGELCGTYCNPTNNSFTCDENGNAICMPGYFGPSCTRIDYCYPKLCAEDAQCENTDVGFKCICDGKEDAKCYASYKPCLNETCSEHGICKPSPESADGFECECEGRWRGKRCEIPLDACEFEEKRLRELDAGETAVCLNNGTCVNDPNALDFHCQCPPDWGGSRCERSSHQTLAISISSALAVLVCLVVVVLVAILVGKKISGRKRLRQHGFIYSRRNKEKRMTMPIVYDCPDSGQDSSHEYTDIYESGVQLSDDNDRSNADYLTPRQTVNSESPPNLTPRGGC